jgi:hypothetical protein
MARATAWFATAFALVSACAGAPPPSAPSPEPASAPETAAPGAKTATPPAPEAAVDPVLPDAPPPSAPDGPAVFDLDYWASQHELTVDLHVEHCEAADLGEHPGDVIWCDNHSESKKGIVTYTRTLYAARGKRVVKLLEIPVAAGRRDLEQGSHRDAERFHVRLLLRRVDGKDVELSEAPGLDCARAEQENRDIATTAPDLHADFVAATKKVCAARGHYFWARGTLGKSR